MTLTIPGLIMVLIWSISIKAFFPNADLVFKNAFENGFEANATTRYSPGTPVPQDNP